ncbi:MAG TPA: hypothetical protein VKV80_13720 [Streptosporangiaceae bacterium]|nr:hypothetical protein [Streptosporangiaceae bacterium]
MVVVTPLCLLQVPDGIAWAALPPGALGTTGPHPGAGVLRVSGLALPAMAAAGGAGALAARKLRAWPVLLAGLFLVAAADVLGGTARTVAMAGAGRLVYGLGAGIALAAVLALVWERSPRARSLLSALWAAVTVTGLVAAVPMIRLEVAHGHWRAALQPYPWLTVAGMAAAVGYAALAGVAAAPSRRARAARTPERAQLALLAGPPAALSVMAVAAGWRSSAALPAVAVVVMGLLIGVAVVASADTVTGGALCPPLAGAVTGILLAPAASAVTSLHGLIPATRAAGSTPRSWLPLAAVAGAAITGAAITAAMRHGPAGRGGGDAGGGPAGEAGSGRGAGFRDGTGSGGTGGSGGPGRPREGGARRAVALAGLVLALISLGGLAAGHGTGHLTGLHAARPAHAGSGLFTISAMSTAPAGHAASAALAAVSAALAGGLAASLAASLGEATAASALSAVTLMLAGVLAGRLAGAAGLWAPAGAAAAAVAAIVMFLAGRGRRGSVSAANRG